MTILHEFTEIETGKGTDALDRRPRLAEALAAARKERCPVIVAKLDRLSRDVAFIAGLMANACPLSWLSSVRTPILSCSTSTPHSPKRSVG
jgi:hypothetical protein